jgi:hypothetical protein
MAIVAPDMTVRALITQQVVCSQPLSHVLGILVQRLNSAVGSMTMVI